MNETSETTFLPRTPTDSISGQRFGRAAPPSTSLLDGLLEQRLLPDALVRYGIRRLLRKRLEEEARDSIEEHQNQLNRFIEGLDKSPIAIETGTANEQHYELPADFFLRVLGPRLKYSSGLWEAGVDSLAGAEEAMLRLSCERAELADGQRILELGCGWGSLTLWMAERYPRSRIFGISNSSSQREYIMGRASRAGLTNIEVVTCDMREFDTADRFDRVVSVEMFEHMKNYRELFGRVARWLRPDGRFFLHIFTHRHTPYHFVARDASDWMSRYFFTGGMMPSASLPLYFQDRLTLDSHWTVNGNHYRRTAEAWLENLRRNREAVMTVFEATYGKRAMGKWRTYWEIFFLACAELFGFRDGNEWFVSHYRFRSRD